jgi:hypothetical protein
MPTAPWHPARGAAHIETGSEERTLMANAPNGGPDTAPAKRGEAAYRQHTDDIAQRNEAARRRARGERDERDREVAARDRLLELHEAADLAHIDTSG